MQVAALLEDSMHLPGWFDSAVTAALLLGFPIAMLLTWAFEMTPEGVKLTEELVEGKEAISGQKMDGIIILGLAAVLGLGAYQQMTKPDVIYVEKDGTAIMQSSNYGNAPPSPISEPVTAIDDASIAVLAFADLSPAGDQGYFSDGIAEEILNVLVRVDNLKVASRTSAFGFNGQESLGIPLIAEKLQVRHVLEGSVRRSGETVRITAQLIDAKADVHLWSQTYDRTLTANNIFAVQDEISSEIVRALRTHLNVEIGVVKAVNMDTENIGAYDLFLKARQKFFVQSKANLPEIINLAKQAIELDPDFAQAWAGLAAAYSVSPSWGVPGDDHIENSDASAKKAIALDSNLALPYAVLANNLENFSPMNYEQYFALSDKALLLDPKNSTALLWRGISEITLGFFDRADARFETCLAIDPAYQNCRRFMALSKLYAGKTDEAFTLFDSGVIKGSLSQLSSFEWALFASGQHRAGAYLQSLIWKTFSPSFDYSLLYRRHTDTTFNFDKELKLFKAGIEAQSGSPFHWSDLPFGNLIAFQLKDYANIRPSYVQMFWWERTAPDFLVSTHRKRLIRKIGIYDYWRKAGFPPQCKPVGSDDFECD